MFLEGVEEVFDRGVEGVVETTIFVVLSVEISELKGYL